MRGIDQDRSRVATSPTARTTAPTSCPPSQRRVRAARRAQIRSSTPRVSPERVGEDWLNRLLYVDLKTFLPCLNLTYTDKMSMAASTEVRVPLLDDEVVDSQQDPAGPEAEAHRRKYVLKRSDGGRAPRRRDLAPEGRIQRPPRAWIGRRLRPLVDDLPVARSRPRAWPLRSRGSRCAGPRQRRGDRRQRPADLGAARPRALATEFVDGVAARTPGSPASRNSFRRSR